LEDAEKCIVAIAAHVNSDSITEVMGTIASKIETGRAGQKFEAAACLLGEVIDAAEAAPSNPTDLLDTLVAGSLLASKDGDTNHTCAAAFGRALASLGRRCGAAALVEEGVPRIHATLQGSEAHSEEITRDAFEGLLAVLQNGVSGNPAYRVEAVEASAMLLRRVSSPLLQVHAVKCAGPLVRALAEKSVDSMLQAAILDALEVLLLRGGNVLRPLAPVLQTALLKLLEGSEEYRPAAARAIGALAPVMPRPEALFKALGKASRSAALLDAMVGALSALPSPLPEAVVREAMAVVDAASGDKDSAVRAAVDRVASLLKDH
jgi:hypothetical protein